MKLVYTPEGATRREFDFQPRRLMSAEAEAIEDATRLDFDVALERLQSGNVRALRAFLWVLMKRELPTLKFAELEFRIDEVSVELSDEESVEILRELEARVARGEELEPDIAEILAALRSEYPDALTASAQADETEDAGDPVGKVTGTDETTTGGSSPTS